LFPKALLLTIAPTVSNQVFAIMDNPEHTHPLSGKKADTVPKSVSEPIKKHSLKI